jgi:hypothetical protein
VLFQVVGTWNDMRDNSAEWTTVEAAKQRRMMKHSHGLTDDDMDKLREQTGTAESEEMRKCDEELETAVPVFLLHFVLLRCVRDALLTIFVLCA